MASSQSYLEYVLDQIEPDCEVTSKKMFGEWGLFSGGKMWGMICDDRLFVKPTEGGLAHIPTVVLAPPYPGAKHIPVIEDGLEDREWLSELVRITTAELPMPKARKPKKPKAKKSKAPKKKG